MKHLIRLLMCLPIAVGAYAQGDPGRPNVVLIVTDDQGYGDIAAHGNGVIQTPHTDALHAQSVRLTDFHVDPTCSPTRSALMTGRYSMRTGVWHTIQGRSMLDPDETTLAEALRDAGYATGLFGKWHLGDAYPCRPEDQGFTTVLAHGGGGVGQLPDYWGNDYFDDHYRSNTDGWQPYEGYCTDVWFEQATAWIDARKDQDTPFFCYIPTNAPHGPFFAPESYIDLYRDKGLEGTHAAFYGMITCIDDNIGRLMAYLDEQGLAENTIVIYMTDNGSTGAPRRGTGEGAYNAGMRGYKGSVYEGGHRVPCFVRWPAGGIGGSAAAARDIDALTAHIDLMPTLLELCGIGDLDTVGKGFDGMSIAAPLRGEGAVPEGRTIVVQSQRIEVPARGRRYCVLSETYRLVNGQELYDIEQDPGQAVDLAADPSDAQAAAAAELVGAYGAWWDDLTADLPDVAYILGDDAANPTHLTSHDLHHNNPGHDGAPWHQNHVKNNARGSGYLLVDIAQPGRYRFTLRRFPVEHGGPSGAAQAAVALGDQRAGVEADPQASSAVIEMDIAEAGRAQLRATLTDAEGVERPAFFVQVERLD